MGLLDDLVANPTRHGGPTGIEKLRAMAAEYEATVGPEACWIWPRSRGRRPQVMIDGHNHGAHRAMYRLFVDRHVARYKHLHHTCERPDCVNYRHVTPLTPSEHNAVHLRSRATRKERA